VEAQAVEKFSLQEWNSLLFDLDIGSQQSYQPEPLSHNSSIILSSSEDESSHENSAHSSVDANNFEVAKPIKDTMDNKLSLKSLAQSPESILCAQLEKMSLSTKNKASVSFDSSSSLVLAQQMIPAGFQLRKFHA
jgi:hypothetical protein